MNRRVFSFWGVLIVAALGLLALPRTGSGQQPVYQPPLSSLPNFGYYNPAATYYPRPSYHPSFGYGFSPMYGGHYHLYYIPHMDRIPQRDKPPPDLMAHLTVLVPEGAELWFNGTKVEGEGTVRKFHTPPLERDRRYSYDVRLRYRKDGREVTETHKVRVSAGAQAKVDFTTRDDAKR
jgi:uncharacterized protein (TIGR03000 family)